MGAVASYAFFIGADLMGEFDTREEAERALDAMVQAEPSAAEEFAVFELDESGKFVGEPLRRTAA